MLFASELAALSGMNPYQSVQEAWVVAMSRNGVSVPSKVADAIKVEACREQAILEKHKTACEELTKSELPPALNPALPQSQLEKQVILKHVNKARGTNIEPKILGKVNSQDPDKSYVKTDKFQSKLLVSLGKHQVYIGGKFDAEGKDGELLEIKSRQNRLFHKVPMYEKVQVHAYMHISGKRSIRVVENFSGETRSDVVEWDQTLWNTVTSRVESEFLQWMK